jgi:hypothetical protein
MPGSELVNTRVIDGLVEASEIANGALYMLSEKSSYSTVAILDVSGGWVSP